jgi:hypothetical protein
VTLDLVMTAQRALLESHRAAQMTEPSTERKPSALERPAAFSDQPFDDAIARATAEHRWLLVDVVDASNPKSWAAAYTTWRDSDLVAWIEKYAIAIQLDARAHADTARALKVDRASAPLVILFRDGKERVRIAGLQSATELLQKLVRFDVAEDNLALQRKMLKDPERDMMDREGLAEALLRAGMLEDSFGHYDWLWQHMAEVDPETAGVRVSFMANRIMELCDRLPAARVRFVAHRDATLARASTADRVGLSACEDLVVLNDIVGDDDHTLAWLDRLDAGQRRALRGGLIPLHLVPLLYERERWADAGALIEDPMADLERIFEQAKTFADVRPRDLGAYRRHLIEEGRLTEAKATRRLSQGLHRDVAMLHRSLVAAGRDEEAATVKDAALRFEDSSAMRAALR